RKAGSAHRAEHARAWAHGFDRGSNRARVLYLMERGLARFRAVYDLVDCTGPVFDIRCSQGGELFPKGYTSMQVFRDADDLIFVHNKRNIYGGGEKTVAIGRLPAAAVRFYRLCGGV